MMNTNNTGDKPDKNSRDIENPPSNNQYNRSENRDGLESEWNLAEQLRLWLEKNQITNRDVYTNSYQFNSLFCKSIENLTGSMLGGKPAMAYQIRKDFDGILSVMKEYDDLCEKRCDNADEAMILNHVRGRLQMLIQKLADLIEGRCRLPHEHPNSLKQERLKTLTQRTPPYRITELPAKQSSSSKADDRVPVHNNSTQTISKEWISFAEAVKLAGGVNKSTLTRWADERKIECNGKSGRDRKLNKISVMLYKQAVDEKNQKKDNQDVAEDKGY